MPNKKLIATSAQAQGSDYFLNKILDTQALRNQVLMAVLRAFWALALLSVCIAGYIMNACTVTGLVIAFAIIACSALLHKGIYSNRQRKIYQPGIDYLAWILDTVLLGVSATLFLQWHLVPGAAQTPAFLVSVLIAGQVFSILRNQFIIIWLQGLVTLVFSVAIWSWWGASVRYHLLWVGLSIAMTSMVALIYQWHTSSSGVKRLLSKAREEVRMREEEVQAQQEEIEMQRNFLNEKNDALENRYNEIQQSIAYASHIQSALLPDKELLQRAFSDCFIFCRPKEMVSGDFYWFSHVNNKIILAAADATGHGVPAAFMSVMGINFLNEITRHHKEAIGAGHFNAGDFLGRLRKRITRALHQYTGNPSSDGMDIALLLIDQHSLQAEFAGAFNPLYVIRNQQLIKWKGDRMPAGRYANHEQYFSNHQLQLYQGDLLYLFSDGFIDQFGGAKNKKLKRRRFDQLLLDIHFLSMQDQATQLRLFFDEWRGSNDQIDDVLLIGVKI